MVVSFTVQKKKAVFEGAFEKGQALSRRCDAFECSPLWMQPPNGDTAYRSRRLVLRQQKHNDSQFKLIEH